MSLHDVVQISTEVIMLTSQPGLSCNTSLCTTRGDSLIAPGSYRKEIDEHLSQKHIFFYHILLSSLRRKI